ncbi:hypothetical protein Pelo_18813 [Pelomyxa schiedti]|nr:hypothetical protein Pelo_18813 [Pelomyxa schiedti]
MMTIIPLLGLCQSAVGHWFREPHSVPCNNTSPSAKAIMLMFMFHQSVAVVLSAPSVNLKQYFQQTPGGWECNYRADPSAPKCKHKPFALSAGTSTLGYHLERAHKFVKKSQQPTPTATQTIDKYVQAVLADRIPGLSKNQLDVALAFTMLGLPFSMLSSPYFRRILSPEKIYGASPEKLMKLWISCREVPRAELTSQLLAQLSKHVSQTDPIQLGCAKTGLTCSNYWLASLAISPFLSELAILLCGVAATEADCEIVFSWKVKITQLTVNPVKG